MTFTSTRRHVTQALGLGVLLAACAGSRGSEGVAVTEISPEPTGPRVLAIFAHPDDETSVAGALYKTATFLDGACDLVVITNGEAGFKYATLAERYYGLELTDEEVGREELPGIRRAELLEGARILGLRSVHFLGERDHRYTTDPWEVLDPAGGAWDVERLEAELARLVADGDYDFVLTMAPATGTHGHHQAATVLAARAVSSLPERRRPVLLGVVVETAESGPPTRPAPLPGLSETTLTDDGPFVFDRTQTFGHRNQLDYRVLVNSLIAAHRSQGTMQLAMNRGLREHYFPFAVGSPDVVGRAARWFDALEAPQFPAREYGPSAGTNAGAE